MNEHEELELLDLEDDVEIEMPEGFEATPRPKRPWLLLLASVVVIALTSYIIIRIAVTDPDNVVDIRLELPVQGQEAELPTAPAAVTAEPVVEPTGMPVRVVEDRAEVRFNPAVEVPRPRPVQPQGAARENRPAAQPRPAAPARPAAAPRPQPQTATGWMVQFGAYDTREGALAAERRLRARHSRLFEGRQFVVLTAQVNGRTTHRLRVTGFASGPDANGFCNNAKSDGLDCFVAR